MKPLLYLTYRSTWNGVKRALTSGRRMLGLLFVAFYYFFFFIRPFQPQRMPSDPAPALDAPLDVVHAVVFAIFALFTLILAMGILTPRGGFRPADVDVLFPTPVNPKLVLVFRMFRDYLITLLFPILMALLTWRPTSTALDLLFRNLDQGTVGYLSRAWTLAWMLMSLAWVTIGYAASLFVNRSDLASDRNRRIGTFGALAFIVLLGGYLALRASNVHSFGAALELAHDPVLRAVFFTATLATWAVMGPITGNLIWTALGLGALAGICAVATRVALTQVGWMYDQAAAKGFDSLRARTLQQKGDMIGLMAEHARAGKLRAGRGRWLQRLRAPGPRAILWREAVIQLRSMWAMLALFGLSTMVVSLLPLVVGIRKPEVLGYFFLGAQAFTSFIMASVVAQSGFIEMLRRVDAAKPLPFTPMTIAAAEIAAKAMPAILFMWIGSVVAMVLRPDLWPYVLGSLVLSPAAAVLMSGAVCVITVLFPDVDDPTQRGFRGMMMMLGFAVLAVPVVGSFAVTAALFGFSSALAPLLACFTAAAVALGLSLATAFVSGNLYATYNPSE